MALSSTLVHWARRWHRRRARARAIQELRRSLALIVDQEALEASVAASFQELFEPDLLLILRLEQGSDQLLPSPRSRGLPDDQVVSLAADGRLARWFLTNETYLLLPRDRGVLDYLDTAERQQLQDLHVRLGVPLLALNHLVGMVLLGYRESDRYLSRGDAELLRRLADPASLAFANAALYREQRERLDRLHRAERLASVGQLAAGVAHEVRNPLTAIRSTMQYLSSSWDEEEPRREMVQELIGEVDRIDHTISGLLSLTRSGELRLGEVDLAQLMDQTIRLVDARARKQQVRLSASYNRPLPTLRADEGQLKQVLLNLVLNAMQAMPEGGRIELLCSSTSGAAEDGRWLNVQVRDDGPGMPEEVQRRVFDPFFTTKAEGTGLGLAICHGIIEQHRGELTLHSQPGEGTTVSIRLPLANGRGAERQG